MKEKLLNEIRKCKESMTDCYGSNEKMRRERQQLESVIGELSRKLEIHEMVGKNTSNSHEKVAKSEECSYDLAAAALAQCMNQDFDNFSGYKSPNLETFLRRSRHETL